MELLEITFRDLLNPEFYIVNGGLWLLLFIVFAETGLFAGFFLPGDSLLFVAGILAHEIKDPDGNVKPGLGYQFLKHLGFEPLAYTYWLDLLVLVSLVAVAAILGNAVGYWTGRKVGPTMFTWKDKLLFKKKYLTQAHDFYEENGAGTIVMARFLPIIRTFAPIVAGIVNMDRKKFTFYNIIGSIAWSASMILAGFFLYKILLDKLNFDLKEHLELIVLGIVVVTTAPVIYKLFFAKKKEKPQQPVS
ncbi:MAG TPA: VTT domain-containing protein [Ferruginibacter sp.]|nr:VTT domain-containing protein [Ferruginibacter sp.]HRE64370.1 VTT domain-containing protein [Ferruginibacter sp.]